MIAVLPLRTLCLTCLTLAAALPGADDPNARIDAAVVAFEETVAKTFDRAVSPLERYLERRHEDILELLEERLEIMQEVGQRRFLAYNILRIDPTHVEAQAVFADGVTPFDPEVPGLHAGVIGSIPAPVQSHLALAALDWHDHNREAVVDAASDVLRRFSSRKRRAAIKLNEQLNEIARAFPSLAASVQQFYFPPEGHAGLMWISPVDRFLLRHGLVTTSALAESAGQSHTGQTDYQRYLEQQRALQMANNPGAQTQVQRFMPTSAIQLPLTIPNFRLEVAPDGEQPYQVGVMSAAGRRLVLGVGPEAIRVSDGMGEAWFEHALERPATTVSLDIHQRQALISVNGAPVATFSLPRAIAARSLAGQSGASALVARLRFLDDQPLLAAGTAAPAAASGPTQPAEPAAPVAAAKPAEPASVSAAVLATRVTIAADLQPASEVVEAIARMSGVDLRLGESAEAFAEVPVSLVAQDQSMEQVLVWFERLLEFKYRAEGDAIVLTWGE